MERIGASTPLSTFVLTSDGGWAGTGGATSATAAAGAVLRFFSAGGLGGNARTGFSSSSSSETSESVSTGPFAPVLVDSVLTDIGRERRRRTGLTSSSSLSLERSISQICEALPLPSSRRFEAEALVVREGGAGVPAGVVDGFGEGEKGVGCC